MKTRYIVVLAAVTALLGFSTVTLYNAYSNTKDKLDSATEALVAAEDRLESRFIYNQYVKDVQYENYMQKLQIRDRAGTVKSVTSAGINNAALNELRLYSGEVRQRAIELTEGVH